MDAAQPAVEPMVREPVGAPRHDVTPKRCDRERPRPRRRLARAELCASERLDRVARELVRALVQRVTAVAAYLVPDDVVALGLG